MSCGKLKRKMSRQTSKNRLVDKYLNGKINKFPEVSFIKVLQQEKYLGKHRFRVSVNMGKGKSFGDVSF